MKCSSTKKNPIIVHWYHAFLVFQRMSPLGIHVESSYVIFLILLRIIIQFPLFDPLMCSLNRFAHSKTALHCILWVNPAWLW